jgi:hypothetical protein
LPKPTFRVLKQPCSDKRSRCARPIFQGIKTRQTMCKDSSPNFCDKKRTLKRVRCPSVDFPASPACAPPGRFKPLRQHLVEYRCKLKTFLFKTFFFGDIRLSNYCILQRLFLTQVDSFRFDLSCVFGHSPSLMLPDEEREKLEVIEEVAFRDEKHHHCRHRRRRPPPP